MNIDEMPAGQEMDALVGENVMGIDLSALKEHTWGETDRFEAHPYCAFHVCTRCGAMESIGCSHYPDDGVCKRSPRRYSTDIAAAWPVLEKTRARLPGKEVMLCWIDGWLVGALVQVPSTIEIGEKLGSGDTAPLAICRAALKAVGYDTHNTQD